MYSIYYNTNKYNTEPRYCAPCVLFSKSVCTPFPLLDLIYNKSNHAPYKQEAKGKPASLLYNSEPIAKTQKQKANNNILHSI